MQEESMLKVLISMPDCSTDRVTREDYFGRGANNSSFFFIPTNVPGGTGPKQGRFGTLGRDTFRGPGFHNFDMAMIKDTSFGKRAAASLACSSFARNFLMC